MIKNAYIHIPFCKSKCNYCSFISFEQIGLIEEYLKALEKEITHYYKGEKLNTLYIGGGTPSLLNVNQITKILNLFKFENNAEVTIELNPNDIDQKYLDELSKTKINRLSFGVQSFNDELLKIIGRRHSSKEAVDVINSANNAGFANISIDLIYGLPNQTYKAFKNDVEFALKLPITHISFYGLKIEKGCKFYSNMPNNLPDLDMQADMYEFICETLPKNGFEHYEISNFSKKDCNSKHNLNYWDNNSYYGFGVGAHGFDGENRYSNKSTIKTYLDNPIEHEDCYKLTPEEHLEEEIFLGFRKGSGINTNKIKQKFGFDFDTKFKNILDKYKDYLIKTDNGYAFNTNGFLISDVILSEFMQ